MEAGQYRTVSFRLARAEYERLMQAALVDAIHRRRSCSFSRFVREALERACPGERLAPEPQPQSF